jgi:hypothetical protein
LRLEDDQQHRFKEQSHQWYEELPQGFKDTTKQFTKNGCFQVIELAFLAILGLHSPLAHLVNHWSQLFFVELHYELREALDNETIDFCA